MIFYGNNEQGTSRAGFDYFMGKRQMQTSLISDTDIIAFGYMNHVRYNGLDCLYDVFTISFDDDLWAIASSPKLTIIHQPLEQLAPNSLEIMTESILDPSKHFL